MCRIHASRAMCMWTTWGSCWNADSGSVGLGWMQDAMFLRSSRVVWRLLVWGPHFEQQGAGMFICTTESLSFLLWTLGGWLGGPQQQARTSANSWLWPRRSTRGQEEWEVRGFYSSGDYSLLGNCRFAVSLYQRSYLPSARSPHFLSCRIPVTALSPPPSGLGWQWLPTVSSSGVLHQLLRLLVNSAHSSVISPLVHGPHFFSQVYHLSPAGTLTAISTVSARFFVIIAEHWKQANCASLKND